MLSYSSCSDFYKCPYLFQLHDEVNVVTDAMKLGANIDTMLNVLMVKHIKDPKVKMDAIVRLGISDMLMKMADNGDLNQMFEIPRMVKEWYIDFVQSGLEVLDVQKHFIIDELDYHGYIDAVLWDVKEKIVVENKTTSRFYDKYMASKKESYQAVGYAIAEGTNKVRYQFFNTKNMNEYAPYSKVVTPEEFCEFEEWVKFVRDNQHCIVKNREYCSLNRCLGKDLCNEAS